ncbi:cubilin homolog [Musca domestica]|uniref:Cubilin homolog n=1 Tax=Musca domestica TaxID=7370 RepID=A0ABM3VKQ1_MUSDO|nr:cubilin homolog [Musca domestica]
MMALIGMHHSCHPAKLCIPQNVSQIQMNSSSNYLAIQYKLALPRPIMSRRWNLTYREYSTCNEEYRLIPEANSINITSPNYPNVPPPHTECEWRVMAPRGELIDIKFFDDFHMNTKYCDREYVELFDGATALAKSLGKYCRTPPPLKTTQNLLYIHYLTDVSEPRAGFKVQLSIGKCGGTFTASSEIITSPGYPQPGAYPAHSECDYVISQPADTRIRLILLNINLPFNHNFPKSKDYLEIIPIIPAEVNETIPSVFVFGNATRGTQIDLNVNKAIIRFHTSARATLYHGFQIKFNRFSGQCHQEMEGVSGPITLSFPRRSFYSSYCRWKMTVPKGLRVRLEFLNMGDFEVQNESRSISFTIYNDHEMQSKILTFDMNSYDPNTIIQSSDNTMLVSIYIPTMTMPYRSLKAHYYSDSESFCPPNIDETKLEGRIDIGDWQPNFQQPYYCKAKINLNPSETLVFNISRFELKTLGGMPRVVNALSFRDNLVIASYRENLTQVLHPQSQPVGFWQIIQTDYERIVKLSMSYRRHACGGNYVVRDGLTIEQPDIRDIGYGAIMCVWSLNRPYYYGRTDAAFRLVGNFTFSDSCEREFILIKEQRWQTDAVKKLCRGEGEDTSLDYNLKHSRSFVVYQAESYVYSKTQFHFEAKKTIVCGSKTMVTFASTRVEVDRQTYRNNEECLWIFKAQRGFYLQVTFYGRFFVEHSENCSRDYVEIQHKEDGLWIPDVRYCGRDLPPIYNSSTNQIQIIFRTNENVTADGFSLFVRSHCSLVVNVTSSEVKTIYRPQNLPYRNLRTQCEYIFQSNEKDN